MSIRTIGGTTPKFTFHGGARWDEKHSAWRYSTLMNRMHDALENAWTGRLRTGRELRAALAVNRQTGGVIMTYVASPSHSAGDPARIEDLRQCLDTARKHLNETSKASDAEKQAELIASALDAGWTDEEVRSEVIDGANDRTEGDVFLTPTLGVVPSSSM
jgi:hypothetical protein